MFLCMHKQPCHLNHRRHPLQEPQRAPSATTRHGDQIFVRLLVLFVGTAHVLPSLFGFPIDQADKALSARYPYVNRRVRLANKKTKSESWALCLRSSVTACSEVAPG